MSNQKIVQERNKTEFKSYNNYNKEKICRLEANQEKYEKLGYIF